MKDKIIELEKLRRSQGLTQKQICLRLGSTEKSYANWRHGVLPSAPYAEKIIKLVEELRSKEHDKSNGKAIQNKLLDTLGQNYFDKRSGEDLCKFWRIARLTELRTVLAETENVYEDNSIVLQLERLCRKGLILCFGVDALDVSDYKFYFEIGEGKYGWREGLWPEIVRLYKDAPLTPEELQRPEIVLNISDRCNRLEQDRRKYFESKFGKPETTSAKIVREDYQDDCEKNERQARLLNATEKLGEDKK